MSVILRIDLILIVEEDNIFFSETAMTLKGKLWRQFLLNDENNRFKMNTTKNYPFNIKNEGRAMKGIVNNIIFKNIYNC